MKQVGRDVIYNSISGQNKPSLTIHPGETFRVQTELCSGAWLGKLGDEFIEESRIYTNPTVCVQVEGAMPGSALSVQILSIEPEDIGYTGIFKSNPLFSRFFEKDQSKITRTVAICDGKVRFSEDICLPVSPMIGVLATAPAHGVLHSTCASTNGGNMDIQEVRAGTTVYLPVDFPGAMLHIGDTHAIQGDGELDCAGGIECRSAVTLKVDVIGRPAGMEWVRMEDKETIMAAAFCEQTDDAFYEAVHEMLRWLENGYGMSHTEAYMLLAQVMHARNTQFVNPTRSYICKVDRRYLPESV